MVWEWSGDPLDGVGVVGRHSWKSGSGREALPKVRVAHPEVREWMGGPPKGLGDPPGYPGVVGRLSRRCGSGW